MMGPFRAIVAGPEAARPMGRARSALPSLPPDTAGIRHWAPRRMRARKIEKAIGSGTRGPSGRIPLALAVFWASFIVTRPRLRQVRAGF